MKKRFINISIFLFCILFLTSCGNMEETGTACQQVTYGIAYVQETSVYLPGCTICNETGALTASATAERSLYYYDQNNGSSTQIDWKPMENEYILSIAQNKSSLYICSYTEDMFYIKKQTDFETWSIVTEFDKNTLDNFEWLWVDEKENLYFIGEDSVTVWNQKDNVFISHTWKGSPLFLSENGTGTVECGVNTRDGLALYDISTEENILKWNSDITCKDMIYIENPDLTRLTFISGDTFYSLEKETGKVLAQSDFLKSGISSSEIYTGIMQESETGDMLYLYGQDDNSNLIIYGLSEQVEKERTELVYGTFGLNSAMHEKIISFNKENPDYYISVRVYGDGFDDDYENQKLKLQADLAAGSGPDILDMYSIDEYENYAKKGYLADLTDYLTNMEESEDILWQVLESQSVDEKYYVLFPHYVVSGIVINPEFAEQSEGWDIDTFFSIIDENQGEKDIFFLLTAENLLQTCLYGMQNEYIDYENATCNFTDSSFIQLLEYCKNNGGEGGKAGEAYFLDEIIDNTLFINTFFSFPSSLACYYDYIDDMTFLGYPTMTGQTYLISRRPDACSIYAGSENKDGAWEFLKMLLDSSYDDDNASDGGFSILKSHLENQFQDYKNNPVKFNGHTEAAVLTDEQIDDFLYILENENLAGNLMDEQIENIVLEEAQSFFAGDKKAEDVAEVIQSRVQIILDE